MSYFAVISNVSDVILSSSIGNFQTTVKWVHVFLVCLLLNEKVACKKKMLFLLKFLAGRIAQSI
jgi:hypothetical protein